MKITSNFAEVKKMTDTNFEIQNLKLDEVLNELYGLREENQALKLDNDFLQRQNAACKLRCSKYALQVRELESEIANLKFTHNYLTSEEAGRQLARELTGRA